MTVIAVQTLICPTSPAQRPVTNTLVTKTEPFRVIFSAPQAYFLADKGTSYVHLISQRYQLLPQHRDLNAVIHDASGTYWGSLGDDGQIRKWFKQVDQPIAEVVKLRQVSRLTRILGEPRITSGPLDELGTLRSVWHISNRESAERFEGFEVTIGCQKDEDEIAFCIVRRASVLK